ncbi:enoyl-CoA hydratase [Erythrobacter litoralis]|uniref:enoyl-CoA hydratase/isomerase family protein n=1 Tax=Erythrobacter litoralis TaxID=39960 RepID=UPI0024351E5A|nr:enoyl-CoA hydratase-related protein [Erythrobacter litoralis]MDG6079839.1 enoyl-CoA hydratase [Erythrobacter litoralis]
MKVILEFGVSEELVKKQVDEGICTLTLNRPDVLNALDTYLMRELHKALQDVAEDEDIRCVILTGEGKGFCAGGDIRAIAKAAKDRAVASQERSSDKPKGSGFEKRVGWVRRSAEASRLLHEMPKPTIAMINGACAGAGMSLAAACDFRVAGTSAKFRSAFTSGGVSGDYGGSWLWTHILGTAKARQLYLLDAKRNAKEAQDFGLVDAVYEDEHLASEVFEMARRLARLPGEAAAYAKINLNAALMETFVTSLDRESRAMMLSRDLLAKRRKTEISEAKSEAHVGE